MVAWGNRAAWCVLGTRFGDGADFAATWAKWQRDTTRPGMLHYVAIAQAAPDIDSLCRHLRTLALPASLDPPWFVPGALISPGFHRLEFASGRVLLTLCIGPLQAMLRELEFMADTLRVGASPGEATTTTWDIRTIKSLARLCRRGTTLQLADPAPDLMRSLHQAGFVPAPDTGNPAQCAVYQPHWEPGTSRQHWRRPPAPPAHCIVVGAGLAGATVAASLARRGWQVTVLDACPAPAGGASGLPVGLLVPQVSRDDAARSRISRAGVHLTLQWCRDMLCQGEDWAPSGVRQLQPEAGTGASHWHADAGWVKPARLVAACLSLPGIRFSGGSRVGPIHKAKSEWIVQDAQGGVLAQAPHVVLAAAGETRCLSLAATDTDGRPLPGLHGLGDMPLVHGQVSWGFREPGDAAHFPTVPVNGRGHFLPEAPVEGRSAWLLGATYEPATRPGLIEQAAHAENRQRLAELLPQTEMALADRFDGGLVRSWRGTRCTTRDRLPGVGPLQPGADPGLWMSAGMGSRGLTHAILCAELLAARIGGEPLPIEGSLARLLAATRPGLSHHL